ncbi:MAG: dynamin, partial [Deltaproteobacteria bacterium]|nr:dynamin [Deltaproteobacteria bacterium]
KMGKAFQSLCDRFLRRINGTLDTMLQFSSQLFSLPFERISSESRWKVESRFYYKFEEDPVGLDLLESSLTEVFPGWVSNRFAKLKAFLFRVANRRIVKKRKAHLVQTIEMQAGRIRSDLLERLNQSTQAFRSEMLRKVETTADGIAAAIENGVKQKSQGEREVRARQEVLTAELAGIREMREELLRMEKSAENL